MYADDVHEEGIVCDNCLKKFDGVVELESLSEGDKFVIFDELSDVIHTVYKRKKHYIVCIKPIGLRDSYSNNTLVKKHNS